MSELIQEPRPQSRFRLARVETAARLPSLAHPYELTVSVEPVGAEIRPSSFEPAFIPFQTTSPGAEDADLGGLGASGFEEELLAVVKELEESEKSQAPPAPVHPLLEVSAALEPAAPMAAVPIADLTAIAFEPAPVECPTDLSLPILRRRIVSGPDPRPKATRPDIRQTMPEGLKQKLANPGSSEPLKPVRPEPKRPATMVARTSAQPVAQPATPAATQPAPSEPAKAPVIPIRKAQPAEQPAAAAVREPVRAPVAPRDTQPAAQPKGQPSANGPRPQPKAEPRQPEPKAEPAKARPAAQADKPAAVTRETEPPSLGFTAAQNSGGGMKLAFVAVALLVIALAVGWFLFRGGSSRPAIAAATIGTTTEVVQPLAPLGGAGWTSNWGGDAAHNAGKQIAIYRPSMAITDYRIEIEGQIEKKALGWIFRAQNPRNYYVMKLEWIKSGAEPIAALIKYPVIDGREGTRTQVLLPVPVTMGTLFKVRTDVKGSRFSTWVNGQLVDYWNDNQVKLGGAGIYVDKGERALIKITNISALR